jgi:hypothetical protein
MISSNTVISLVSVHTQQELMVQLLDLFPTVFSVKQNAKYQSALLASFERKKWRRFGNGLRNAINIAVQKLADRDTNNSTSSSATDDSSNISSNVNKQQAHTRGDSPNSSNNSNRLAWQKLGDSLQRFERQRYVCICIVYTTLSLHT